MSEREIVYADPFLNKISNTHAVTGNAGHLCTYEVSYGIAETDESAYLIQTNGNDELWLENDYQRMGCAFILCGRRDLEPSCRELLTKLFLSRVGFCWPSKFISPGILDKGVFHDLINQIKTKLDMNIEEADTNKPEIAFVADELGLYVRPSITSANHWRATCPGTNHSLELQSSGNLFFCGYCNRSGGIVELRKFAEDRKVNEI